MKTDRAKEGIFALSVIKIEKTSMRFPTANIRLLVVCIFNILLGMSYAPGLIFADNSAVRAVPDNFGPAAFDHELIDDLASGGQDSMLSGS